MAGADSCSLASSSDPLLLSSLPPLPGLGVAMGPPMSLPGLAGAGLGLPGSVPGLVSSSLRPAPLGEISPSSPPPVYSPRSQRRHSPARSERGYGSRGGYSDGSRGGYPDYRHRGDRDSDSGYRRGDRGSESGEYYRDRRQYRDESPRSDRSSSRYSDREDYRDRRPSSHSSGEKPTEASKLLQLNVFYPGPLTSSPSHYRV